MFNKKGFTLVELMVVIVIIGILAVLAIPKLTGATVKAKISELPTVLGTYDNAQLAYIAETGNLGDKAGITMDAPSSKWWDYDENAAGDGTYKGTAQKAMGDVAAGKGIFTDLTKAVATPPVMAPAHTKDAELTKYLPNWN